MIVFKPSNESLGVIITSSNSSNGFVIAHIDPGSVIDRDGRFRPGDRIVKINGHDLVELNISQVREILRHSGNQVKISVVRPHSEDNKNPRTNLNKSESLRIFRAVSNSHKPQDKTSFPMVRNINSISLACIKQKMIMSSPKIGLAQRINHVGTTLILDLAVQLDV